MKFRSDIHPLFDPAGYYRMATEESIWNDHTHSRLQELFHSRTRLRLLQSRSIEQVPIRLPNHRSKNADFSLQKIECRITENRGDPKSLHGPKVYLLDCSHPELMVRSLETSVQNSAMHSVSRLNLHVSGLEGHRRILGMIWTSEARGHFQTQLLQESQSLFQSCCSYEERLLKSILSVDRLAVSSDPRQRQCASRWADLLALLPGWIMETNSQGVCTLNLALHYSCSPLDLSDWIVLCQGPSMELT